MIEFTKMHGTGNDFIIIDDRKQTIKNYNELSEKMCKRHFGVGADGLIVVKKSISYDIKMLIYNADGSQAPMCGNGIRCFTKYVIDNNILNKKNFIVETLAGPINVKITNNKNNIAFVEVNMGKPVFKGEGIPITDSNGFINQEIVINNNKYNVSTVIVGNVHTIVFVDNIENININKIGNEIETHSLYSLNTNVNFCEIVDSENIKVITWERGVGKTLACGTGASASAFISDYLYNMEDNINVHLLGGTVEISLEEEYIYMRGPAETIFKGNYYNLN